MSVCAFLKEARRNRKIFTTNFELLQLSFLLYCNVISSVCRYLFRCAPKLIAYLHISKYNSELSKLQHSTFCFSRQDTRSTAVSTALFGYLYLPHTHPLHRTRKLDALLTKYSEYGTHSIRNCTTQSRYSTAERTICTTSTRNFCLLLVATMSEPERAVDTTRARRNAGTMYDAFKFSLLND